MKKIILAVMLLLGSLAQAQVPAAEAPFVCSLAFDVAGGGIQVIVGNYKLVGTGTLSCSDKNGVMAPIPLKITMGGPVQGTVAVGVARVMGVATGIGLASSPAEILGDYVVVGGQVALMLGVGAHVALHSAAQALTLNADLQLIQGVGFNIGINTLKIEAVN